MIKEKYMKRIEETSLNILQGKIESVRVKDIEKIGYRVYQDNKIGVAGAVGDYNEEELENSAIEGLKLNIPYESNVTEEHNEHMIIENNLQEGEELIKTFDRVINKVAEENQDFIISGKINIENKTTTLANNRNLDLSHKRKDINISLALKEKTSANIFDLGVGYVSNNFYEEEFYKLFNNILGAYREKVDLPKEGKLPVVFMNRYDEVLMKFMQELNGMKVGTCSSLLKDFMNQKKFHEDFTLYDSRNQDESESPFFDGEGHINEDYRYSLIENGVVKAGYTDKETSRIYNIPYTGSAMGEYDSVQGVMSMPNLVAKPGQKTAKELLNGELAIYILIASGGDFTPDGKFGTPVQVAYLFDGEKFLGRLPELKLSGHIYDIFGNDFRGVSKDKISESMNIHYMIADLDVSKL